jgi:CRISPR/Cas system-associated exonuclease Cas4 (RecB family)
MFSNTPNKKIRGSLDYPKLRKKEVVELDETEETRLKEMLDDIELIIQGKRP